MRVNIMLITSLNNLDFNTILDFIKALGWTKGVFALFFFLAHGWIYVLYMGRIKDRQKEIDRLAKENHEYRDRFLKMLDNRFFGKKSS